MKVILASQSPRRKELIKMLNIEAITIPSKVEEIIDERLSHEEMVMDLAFQKATDVFRNHKEDLVLGFDTLVILGDKIMGKPKNKEEAKGYLKELSGNTHRVITGCAFIKKGHSSSFYSSADVTFYPMTDQEIDEYIETNEPFDKAGAYAIQGYGSKYIQSIYGDYYAIVGFPVSKIYRELKNII
ncbi:MAG: Maf family protein [Tenericutes bacterium]|jgi:septum formation protein|nr:Maf family protein [Mycoplasmatota bacterium]